MYAYTLENVAEKKEEIVFIHVKSVFYFSIFFENSTIKNSYQYFCWF